MPGESLLACSGHGAPGCRCCGRNVALGEKNLGRLDTLTVLTGHQIMTCSILTDKELLVAADV